MAKRLTDDKPLHESMSTSTDKDNIFIQVTAYLLGPFT